MNVTIEELLEAQKTLIETVSDVGVVLIRERYVDDEAWIGLFMALNVDGAARGVMCLWQELAEQTKGPRVGTIQQKHRFSYEMVYPFDDSRPDGRTSHEVFVERIQSVNQALNRLVDQQPQWDLGLTLTHPNSDVEHEFLQSDGPIVVRRWGAGQTALKTHYCSMTLDVWVVTDPRE